MSARYGLRVAALGYLTLLLVLPVGLVFYRTFQHGFGPFWNALTDPDFLHALWLTILIALIAVPLNTIFGVVCALVLVRQQFRGKAVLNAFIDLPFALSPVVVGLALFLVYARTGWFGPWLGAHGIQIVFALPAMVLATIFVSLPFVARSGPSRRRRPGRSAPRRFPLSAGSRCPRSGGGSRTAWCSRPRAAWASSEPCRSCPETSSARRRRSRCT